MHSDPVRDFKHRLVKTQPIFMHPFGVYSDVIILWIYSDLSRIEQDFLEHPVQFGIFLQAFGKPSGAYPPESYHALVLEAPLGYGRASGEEAVIFLAFYRQDIVNLIVLQSAIGKRRWIRLSHPIQYLWMTWTKSMLRPCTLMSPLFVVTLETCENALNSCSLHFLSQIFV
jgi:hypothetical protein